MGVRIMVQISETSGSLVGHRAATRFAARSERS